MTDFKELQKKAVLAGLTKERNNVRKALSDLNCDPLRDLVREGIGRLPGVKGTPGSLVDISITMVSARIHARIGRKDKFPEMKVLGEKGKGR